MSKVVRLDLYLGERFMISFRGRRTTLSSQQTRPQWRPPHGLKFALESVEMWRMRCIYGRYTNLQVRMC